MVLTPESKPWPRLYKCMMFYTSFYTNTAKSLVSVGSSIMKRASCDSDIFVKPKRMLTEKEIEFCIRS